MISEQHRELHQFVKERAGSSYRTAFYYDADDWEAIHVRRDLQLDSLGEEVPDVMERARKDEPLVREEDYPPLGENYARAEIHENGLVFQFPEGPDEGIIVSLDPDAAQVLTGFVTRCLSILETPNTSKYRYRTPSE
ncbi:hypothetical protein HWV23_10780 [Natronomonas halophila]|uniref:hypothetical protein n=1 Tax=Natronomonas halophila TaxID=2747817 RepID=UPI0015B5BE2A|nr:hypothetical protein [Natronomonas halophila]QLD86185.1 hypothetical protein HWV23_10780 [Natronomonas halophila]